MTRPTKNAEAIAAALRSATRWPNEWVPTSLDRGDYKTLEHHGFEVMAQRGTIWVRLNNLKPSLVSLIEESGAKVEPLAPNVSLIRWPEVKK